MAVESTHPIYDDFSDAWRLVRDCIKGSRAIKAAGTTYLPSLYKQSADEYAAYNARAVFFNAVKRTIRALVGFIFRQNPQQIFPAGYGAILNPFFHDATLTGVSWYDYQKETVNATGSVGRRGTLVDWKPRPEDRAFIIPYETEDIIDWRYGRINGTTMLVHLRLKETSREWLELPGDITKRPPTFSTNEFIQYRVYDVLLDEAERAYVQVTVYRKRTQRTGGTPRDPKLSTDDYIVDQQIPMRRGRPLSRIPFVPHGPEKNTIEPTEVPMEDIATINVSHFVNSADLENALHVAGQPTPIACGFTLEKGQELYIGSKTAWVTSEPTAKAEYLSYDSNDASALTGEMERKEKRMAALGARILERQGGGGGQEAFETVQLRHGADHSALMSLAIANTQSLSDVLQWVVWWHDPSVLEPEALDELVKTELNTKFVEMLMDSAMLREIVAAHIAGRLTDEALLRNLQEGGLVGSEVTLPEFIKALQSSKIGVNPDDGSGDGLGGPGPGGGGGAGSDGKSKGGNGDQTE